MPATPAIAAAPPSSSSATRTPSSSWTPGWSLGALGVAPEAVTHVFLSHHHPDHTINIALFPNAEVVDFWARYKDDLWLDHDGDGHRLGPRAELWLTPGHTEEDATLVVDAGDAVYALTHLWWRGDRTPEI